MLLGLLIEKLEQKPIGEVFRERIFERPDLTRAARREVPFPNDVIEVGH